MAAPIHDTCDAHAAGDAHMSLGETPIALDRDGFMRRLVAGLGHLNEGILGSEVAGAYIMNVGLSMGAAIEAEYKRFWGIERPFTLDEYAHVIVDLKRKIQGQFSLVSKDPRKVVVQTTSCPFDEFVRQSPSLCFMTSSVFGGIAARNFGYAKVVLHRRIALGDDGCYVTIHLQRTPEAEVGIGKEYFPDIEQASPDISEQLRLMNSLHRLRHELGEVHSRWEEVVRGAVEAIAVLDSSHRVVYANGRWRDVLGVEGDELTGMDLLQLVLPEEREQLAPALVGAWEGRRTVGLLLRLVHRTGAWRDLRVSLGPVRDEYGSPLAVLLIGHDVTEQREAERLKDDLLTTASHELRTPVATIKMLSELLLHQLERGDTLDPEQLGKRLRTIQRQADRLALLGMDLVDVARLQQGRLKVKRERHDLNDLIQACVSSQRELLAGVEAHHITVRASQVPVYVAIERARIEQVLMNLLENAVKYSPGGGEITVTCEADGDWARVHITDQGIGIPESDLPKLFTPFYRGSNAPSRHFTGLGLGLYLSAAIAEAHGGRLTAESVVGQGATFTLALPRAGADGE
jgi:PAS domain S-box-containing protein